LAERAAPFYRQHYGLKYGRLDSIGTLSYAGNGRPVSSFCRAA